MTNRNDVPPAARIGPNGETALELAHAAVTRMCRQMGVDPPPTPEPAESRFDPGDDPVSVPPTFESRWGKAWLCSDARRGEVPDWNGHVAGWIVEAPWANVMWHSYLVSVIHLRPIPGVRPPVIHLPGATHEMMVIALDPGCARDPTVVNGDGAAFLTPLNFVGQFIAEHDAAALERVERDVLEIVDGNLNPDTDSRASWIARYGAACVR